MESEAPAGDLRIARSGQARGVALFGGRRSVAVAHVAGPRAGLVVTVRGGIGYVYREHFDTITASLGLPLTDEEPAPPHGAQTRFERGVVTWDRARKRVVAWSEDHTPVVQVYVG